MAGSNLDSDMIRHFLAEKNERASLLNELNRSRDRIRALELALQDMLDWADTPAKKASPAFIATACRRAELLLEQTMMPSLRDADDKELPTWKGMGK